MGKKQKKKATQSKKISQKTCAAENEEDKSGIDSCSYDSLSGACMMKIVKGILWI